MRMWWRKHRHCGHAGCGGQWQGVSPHPSTMGIFIRPGPSMMEHSLFMIDLLLLLQGVAIFVFSSDYKPLDAEEQKTHKTSIYVVEENCKETVYRRASERTDGSREDPLARSAQLYDCIPKRRRKTRTVADGLANNSWAQDIQGILGI